MTYQRITNIGRSQLTADVQNALGLAEQATAGNPASGVNFVPQTGTAQVLPDPVLKNLNRLILNANLDLTLPQPSVNKRFYLFAQRDTVGGWTITFKTPVKWANGTQPTQTTGAGKLDWYEFVCPDGVTWVGDMVQADLRTALGSSNTNLMLDAVGVEAAGAYSLRKIKAAYAGSAVRVQRASDNTETDIGFTSGGDLDTTALAAFCAGTTGYVKTWYDQSGLANNLTTTAQTNMMRIYASGMWDKANNKPALYFPDAARGAFTQAPIAQHTGNAISGSIVGVLKSATTSFSPRYLSVWGSSNTDNGDSQGAHLIGRNGGASPTQQWAINRNAAVRASVAAQYDVLQQVDAVINDGSSTYSIAVDGQESAGFVQLGSFDITRIGVGYTGSGYQSVTGQVVAEVVFFKSALDSTQRQVMRSNQQTYYGTGQTTPLPDTPNYVGTLVVSDNYESGQYTASNLNFLNNGHMTSQGGAWMSDMCSISGGALNIGVRLMDTPITVSDPNAAGGSYQTRKRGGYAGWYAPGATRRGGVWVWEMQVPGASQGWGFVPLLWPSDEVWPQHGEIDGPPELFSGNADKTGGECFIHWSANSGASSTHIQKRVPSSGSFGIDWKQRHKCAVAWNPGSDAAGTGAYIKFFIDDVLRGQILATDAADSSGRTGVDYIPHGPNAVAMNLRLQTEGYGTSEANTAAGPLYWKIFKIAHYTLP